MQPPGLADSERKWLFIIDVERLGRAVAGESRTQVQRSVSLVDDVDGKDSRIGVIRILWVEDELVWFEREPGRGLGDGSMEGDGMGSARAVAEELKLRLVDSPQYCHRRAPPLPRIEHVNAR